jgi:mannose-6-phosphate isomerase-like protein (cupin superfamily)
MKILKFSDIEPLSVSHNPLIQKKVLIEHGEIPKITNFSRSRFPPGEAAPAHAHRDMYEVFLVESGSGVFRIDGTDYQVKAGSCVRVDLHETHEIVNTGEDYLVLTYFGVEV